MADAKIVLSAVDQTKVAIESAKRNLSSIGDQVGRLDARLGGLGAAIAVAFTAASFRGAVDLLDKLDDLSEKTGISVENLSALRYAGEVTGTSLESLAAGTKKLAANMAEAASGNKEAMATFRSLRVEVKNSDGSLRSQDAVLLDLADRFAGYQDGAAKAALAQKIFGKAGADMIPLLNQGSDGIKKLRSEAESLGLVFDGKTAKAAAAFNDNLTKLALSSEALKVEIAGGLLPYVNKLVDSFIRLKQAGLIWPVIKDAAKDMIGLGKLSSDPGADINSLLRERARTQKNLDFAKRKGYATRGFQDELFEIEQLLEISRIRQQGQVLTGEEYGDAVSRKFRNGGKTEAPLPPNGDAAAKANRELEQQAKLLAELAGLSGSFAEDWDNLTKIYQRGGLTLEQLTKAQADLLSKQPAMRAAAEAQAKAEKEANDVRDAANKLLSEHIDALTQQRAKQEEGNQALRDEIAEIGLTVQQLAALRAARLDAAIAAKEQALAGLRANEATESEIWLMEEQIRLLNERRGLELTKGKREQLAQEQEDAKKRTETISESIEEGILTGFRNGGSLADVFLNELKAQFAKTVLRPIISPIAEAGSALLGSLMSSVFGGFFADGGRPPMGKVSIVGERGPELFVPDSAGTIIPNGGAAPAQTVVHQHFTVGDVASMSYVRNAVQRSQAQGMAALGRSRNYGGDLA